MEVWSASGDSKGCDPLLALEGSMFVEAAGGFPEDNAWPCRSCSGSDVGTSVGSVFEGFTLEFLPFIEDGMGFRGCFSRAGNGAYRDNGGPSAESHRHGRSGANHL